MIKVLIVEDDPMVAELNKRYLAKVEGFELAASVRSADDALESLDKLEIDLILLDIFMPGVNGLELLSAIREKGKSVDVILITAACDKQNIEKALRNGIVDYLIKPFEFERFSTALVSFRERVKYMRRQDTVNQDILDQLFLNRDKNKFPSMLPKGLDRKTLKNVWENICRLNGVTFDTEEMAANVGVSRVSMRKYLDFLNQAGILSLEITYGSVGRPVYKYRCIDPAGEIIRHYI